MIKKLTVWSLAMLVFCTGLVVDTHAQKSRTSKRKPATPAVTNDKTRARRVASTATPTPTPVESEQPKKDPESVTPLGAAIGTKPAETEKQPEEKPAAKTEAPKPTTPAPPDESIDGLRAQINDAAEGPERLKLRLKLADLLVTEGDKTEAVAELHRVATSEVLDPASFYNLGNAFARLAETDGAVGAYRKAIEQRRGRYSKAYNNLGVVLLRAGRWDEAQEAFLSALKLESFRYAEASYNLGRLYAARGDHDLAVREWRRAVTVDPMHKAAAQAISGIRSDYRITVAATGTSTPTRAKDTAVAEKSRSTNVARSFKPLTLDQTSYDYLQRGRSAAERGNLVEAVDHFRRVISREGGYFGPANLEASYALLTLKKYEEALPYLVQVSTREGARYPISYFHLARLYELKGDFPLAEAAFSQAVAAYGSTNAQFLLDLSRVREKQSNFKGALEAMERYVAAMDQQGTKPSWSEEKLAALRTKIN
jgi:tetratricopeptide (TPR) repeat protein